MKGAVLRVDLFCGAGDAPSSGSPIVDRATGEVLGFEPFAVHDLLVDTGTGEVRAVWRPPHRRAVPAAFNSPEYPSRESWQMFLKIIGFSDAT